MPITVKTGYSYQTAAGDEVGPMIEDSFMSEVFDCGDDHPTHGNSLWNLAGEPLGGDCDQKINDVLVIEIAPPTESETPISFGELSPTCQGALLLAHHNGQAIQVFVGDTHRLAVDGWLVTPRPGFQKDQRFRLSPLRVTGTVQLNRFGDPDFSTWEPA